MSVGQNGSGNTIADVCEKLRMLSLQDRERVLQLLEQMPSSVEQQAKGCISSENEDYYRKIQHGLLLYIPLFLVVVGTFGNIFSFIVLRQKSMPQLSTYFYLASLAITDTVVLYIGLFRLWLLEAIDFDLQDYADWSCKLIAVLGYTASDFSIWLIIAVTVERYIAVCHPLKASEMCNIPRAKIVMVILLFLLFFINAHLFWTVEIDDNKTPVKCEYGDGFELLSEVWPWIDAALYSFLPFITIMILNCLIIRQVKKARHSRQQMQSDSLKQPNRRPSHEQSIKLTIMLLSVSFTFLVSTLPMNTFLIVKAFTEDQYLKTSAQYSLITTIAKLLMYLNHAINFFLYCATGQKFRHQVKRILCRRSKSFFSTFSDFQRTGRERDSVYYSSTKYSNCPTNKLDMELSEMDYHRHERSAVNNNHYH